MRSLQRNKIWTKILTMKFVGHYETPSGGNGQETIGIRHMTKPLYTVLKASISKYPFSYYGIP